MSSKVPCVVLVSREEPTVRWLELLLDVEVSPGHSLHVEQTGSGLSVARRVFAGTFKKIAMRGLIVLLEATSVTTTGQEHTVNTG